MYAIVDIETTGGFAAGSAITEISIILHDGSAAVDQFNTLVNPGEPIPLYIQALTGITDAMVAGAPSFPEIASQVHQLLSDRVFVAHNVNFDFSFLSFHLARAGLDLQAKKLCTVRLSRKIFPGLPSYSLGRLCRHLAIPVNGRHRAAGDAEATVKLFEMLLANDLQGVIAAQLRARSGEQSLPMHLSRTDVDSLPGGPGVYYFHDEKDRIIYVGKAINIRQRVLSHFTNNHPGKRRQDFLRLIHRISFRACPTELMAFILESLEIHRLWPAFNRSQKKFEQQFGLFTYIDQNGYQRLCVEKTRKHSHPIHRFHILAEGTLHLRALAREFQLCPRLCFLETAPGPCSGRESELCLGACEKAEPPLQYNQRVAAALESLEEDLPSFVITDKGLSEGEKSCILVDKGVFYGMGFLPDSFQIDSLDELKSRITAFPENGFIRNLVFRFAEEHPDRVTLTNAAIVAY